MSEIYQGQDPLPAPAADPGHGEWVDIEVPTDEDNIDADALATGLEGCADRDNWLRWHSNDHPEEQTRVRAIRTSPYTCDLIPAGFSDAAGWMNLGARIRWVTTNVDPCVTAGLRLIIPLDVQHEEEIDNVRIYVKGAGAHAALPANLISAKIYSAAVGSDAAGTVEATGASGAASIAAYEAIHSFDVTPGAAVVVDAVNNIYWVEVESEWGAINVLAGAYYLGAKLFYRTSKIANG